MNQFSMLFVWFCSIFLLSTSLCTLADSNVASENENNPNEYQSNQNEEQEESEEDFDKIQVHEDYSGLNYGLYLQEVVRVLEEDPQFKEKSRQMTRDEIMGGKAAKLLEVVGSDVRNRLNRLKQYELERLRKLTLQKHRLEQRHAFKDAHHVDHSNSETFEVEDLQKLIEIGTKDLHELDRKRRENFKQYEMEKEVQYRDKLKKMTPEKRAEIERKRKEVKSKHRVHPKVHHPGSKKQLEEVWAQQDKLPRKEFQPKVFFHIHDINNDDYFDQEEVEALLSIEVRKLYKENDPSYDKNEMEEEYHRMREHFYKDIDANKDGLISLSEFLIFTQSEKFKKDFGWKGIEEVAVYSEEELKKYREERKAKLA